MPFYGNTSFTLLGPALPAGQALNDSLSRSTFSADSAVTVNGTTRALATQLQAAISVCSTVGAGGLALLPQALPGRRAVVFNTGANTLAIQGYVASDTIDGAASTTMTTANRGAEFYCTSPGVWLSAKLGAAIS